MMMLTNLQFQNQQLCQSLDSSQLKITGLPHVECGRVQARPVDHLQMSNLLAQWKIPITKQSMKIFPLPSITSDISWVKQQPLASHRRKAFMLGLELQPPTN